MSLTFYFAPMSTASITEAVLAELAIPFDLIKLNISVGDTRTPEFLKVNPNGRVPAIVHEGTAIWESSAITMYLGEIFGVAAAALSHSRTKAGRSDEMDLHGVMSRLLNQLADYLHPCRLKSRETLRLTRRNT